MTVRSLATARDESTALGYRPALDGLRGVAVLLVMLSHAFIPGFAAGGQVGVTIFFVLSGFLITRLLIERGVNLRQFYIRRARRLLPALFLVLAVYVAVTRDVVPVIWPLLYVANFAHAAGLPMGDLPHTWSVSLEEQFYLLWPPVLLLVAWRRLPWMLVGLAVASAVLRAILWPSPWAEFGPLSRADAILLGCAVGLGLELRWPRVGVALIVLAMLAPEPVLVGVPLAAVGTALLLPSLLGSGPLAWKPLVATGKISYGIYLWHFPLLAWFGLIALPLTFLVAAVSYRYLERPILRRRPHLKDHGGRITRTIAPAESPTVGDV